jgi:hypothetical protein
MTIIAPPMANLHRSPHMNQNRADFGIAEESVSLGFGIHHRYERRAA